MGLTSYFRVQRIMRIHINLLAGPQAGRLKNLMRTRIEHYALYCLSKVD